MEHQKHELIYMDLLNARVCSEGTWDEALDWLQYAHPSGTQHNWSKKTDPPEALPVACADDPKRMHYMFIC